MPLDAHEIVILDTWTLQVWLRLLLPTIIPAATAFGTVFWLFALTTKKERLELEEDRQRTRNAGAAIWLQLTETLRDARMVTNEMYFRDLDARVTGICEYSEIATADVYRFQGIKTFSRFAHLKRIALHYRDELEALKRDVNFLASIKATNHVPAQLESLCRDIQNRMDHYADLCL